MNEMNESALSAFENRLRAGLQTNPAGEQKRNSKWSESRGISPVGKGKVYGGKDLLKSQVFGKSFLP